jgi:hypothetical protein
MLRNNEAESEWACCNVWCYQLVYLEQNRITYTDRGNGVSYSLNPSFKFGFKYESAELNFHDSWILVAIALLGVYYVEYRRALRNYAIWESVLLIVFFCFQLVLM